jgi:hypothetical protein
MSSLVQFVTNGRMQQVPDMTRTPDLLFMALWLKYGRTSQGINSYVLLSSHV